MKRYFFFLLATMPVSSNKMGDSPNIPVKSYSRNSCLPSEVAPDTVQFLWRQNAEAKAHFCP